MEQTLLACVQQTQHRLRCSVLPLDGKRPARGLKSWERLREVQPTQEQLYQWFVEEHKKGYGVILGRSAAGLFVLDFDDPDSYRQFCETHPKSSQTLTVRTRRGYHVYLRYPSNTRSHKISGGDWKGEGSYVVGPGSTVAGHIYTIHCDTEVQTLTRGQYQSIKQGGNSNRAEKRSATAKDKPRDAGKAQQLKNYYKQLVSEQGRNNALYTVARYAQHIGVSERDTHKALRQLHTETRAQRQHTPETKQQREREAQRTIQSAYKSKQAIKTNSTVQLQGQLPNSIREALLQKSKSTAPGRFLEGLLYKQQQPGTYFSKTEAYQVGQHYHISQRDIRWTLQLTINNQPIFRAHAHSHIQSPPAGDKDSLNSKSSQTGKRGRRVQEVFEIPCLDWLCKLLEVSPQTSDPLTEADLCSAKAYRQALHRELVKRRAPEQSTRWHAERLNVSERTIRRYNSQLGVVRTPIIAYTPITQANVDNPDLYGTPMEPRDFTPGQWLQMADGRRFPALKGIALRQLTTQPILIACRQRPSRLQLPTEDQPQILYDALWRRSDLPQADWGGKSTDFPPVDPAPLAYQPDVISPQPPVLGSDHGVIVTGDGQREMLITEDDGLINGQLTLVRGIGERRADRLHDVGIWTMSQLIAVGAKTLAGIGWAGGYVTEHTTQGWIEQAEILLGRRQPDPAVLAVAAAQRARRETMRDFKRYLKQYRRYLEAVHAWEDAVFDTGAFQELSWNQERGWLAAQCDEKGHWRRFTQNEMERFKQRARDFITGYLDRIDQFLDLPATHLEANALGHSKGWGTLRRRGITLWGRFAPVEVSEGIKKS